MKSRTSSFNPTVFKKDLTRFAPAWGAFLIFMLLAVISIGNDRFAFYRLQSIRDCITAFAWLNLIYAAVTAQLIFGDLYNSRMCNAQHALPLRRECWFGTHVAAGLAFSLIPSVLVTLIGLPVLRLEAGWSAAFWWLLGTQLQYLFFFGIAVLCVMLTGNRLGQIALYGMINFGGLLAYWFASAVYQPFLHGVQFPEDPFMLLCPLAQISSATHDVLLIDHQEVVNAFGELETYLIYSVKPGNGWGYLAICAGAGVLALAAALVLYRRRKIECAGDFVAFAAMEPVVTVIVTVFTGGVFHLFADNFRMNLRSVMLGAGMVVGFFACRMLLERTTRVFRKKAFLFCGSIVAVFGLTVLLTYLDPVGITRYVTIKIPSSLSSNDSMDGIWKYYTGYSISTRLPGLGQHTNAVGNFPASASAHSCARSASSKIANTAEPLPVIWETSGEKAAIRRRIAATPSSAVAGSKTLHTCAHTAPRSPRSSAARITVLSG